MTRYKITESELYVELLSMIFFIFVRLHHHKAFKSRITDLAKKTIMMHYIIVMVQGKETQHHSSVITILPLKS